MNKKKLLIIISILIILILIFAIALLIPDAKYMSYKEFKEKVSKKEDLVASINSKEIIFNLKSGDRRVLYRKPRD